MADLPTTYRRGRIARLRRRVRSHEKRLAAAFDRLEGAVRERMPPAQLRSQVREQPYRAVALGLLAGLFVGALLPRRR